MEAGIVEAQDKPPEPDPESISYAESIREPEITATPPPSPAEKEEESAGNVDDAQVSAKKVIEHLFEHYQEQDHWTVFGRQAGCEPREDRRCVS